MKFRYWLNARFSMEGVGKVNIQHFQEVEKLDVSNFMIRDNNSSKIKEYDEFSLVSPV